MAEKAHPTPASEERVMRFDRSALTNTRQGPSGGLIVSGNLRRTGVLEYRLPDGSVRKELCHPDEVFHPDSLASFKSAPVTIDHPGRVHPGNWSDHAIGHVEDEPKRTGSFMQGDFHIQDARGIKGVQDRSLQEVSCGYECALDATPGIYNGQKYDAVQRKVRANHVALGPKGWGRAGPEVRLHTDGGVSDADWTEHLGDAGAVTATIGVDAPATVVPPVVTDSETPTFPGMTPEEKAAFEKAQADLKAQTLELEKLRADAKTATTVAEKAAADAKELEILRAKTATLEQQVARVDGARAAEETAAKREASISEMVTLREDARSVFATAKDPTGSKWAHADSEGRQKSPDTIRREIIAHVRPDVALKNQDGEAYEGDVLAAVYDVVKKNQMRTDAARGQVQQTALAPRIDKSKPAEEETDDDGEPVIDASKARKDMVAWQKDRFKPKGADRKDRSPRDGRDGR